MLRRFPWLVSSRRVLTAQVVSVAFLAACVLQLLGCDKKEAPGVDPKIRQGRTLYSLHCTACHNADPTRDGKLGPAIKGSAHALIEARVLRAEYPAGYSPKRPTHIMPKLPLVAEDVDALHAFLNAP